MNTEILKKFPKELREAKISEETLLWVLGFAVLIACLVPSLAIAYVLGQVEQVPPGKLIGGGKTDEFLQIQVDSMTGDLLVYFHTSHDSLELHFRDTSGGRMVSIQDYGLLSLVTGDETYYDTKSLETSDWKWHLEQLLAGEEKDE